MNQQLILHAFNRLAGLTSPLNICCPGHLPSYLGHRSRYAAWQTRLSKKKKKKIAEYADLLASWRFRTPTRKRELDSPTGILFFFACRVVTPGRPLLAVARLAVASPVSAPSRPRLPRLACFVWSRFCFFQAQNGSRRLRAFPSIGRSFSPRMSLSLCGGSASWASGSRSVVTTGVLWHPRTVGLVLVVGH